MSVKNRCLLKCQGNVREFYNFQFVSNDEKQKMLEQFLNILVTSSIIMISSKLLSKVYL